ncbi:hypothetical protein KVR01_013585 [Diaporthe batatas]|uniref:uncharacterized protein n=1 Tax=Diaporthe batatas TaxID=748121 RepID=UPI001D05260A|nr:uncharacterized protein KVR01_013585 [Diaporthe batatas]KAG8156481.1 hypothetical protein KVR01_013585 [Diaporthe batatas]
MSIKRKAHGESGPEPISKFRRVDSHSPPLPASPQPLWEGGSSNQVISGPQGRIPEDQSSIALIEDPGAGDLAAAASGQASQRFPLTKENLHRLAMSTNSKGPRTASAQSLRSGNSGETSRSISTTSEGFENRALQNGVLDAVRSGKQAVVDTDLKKKLLASRGSASPTQSQYNKFPDRIVEASNEQGTIAVYSKYIFQDTEDSHFDIGYRRKEDKMWTEFPKNVGFNNGLSDPKPDMIEGFARDTFPPTIEHIKSSKLVRDEPKYVALPHMAVEYKAREKSLHEAKVQAGYDGAAMVYGRNEALELIGKVDPPRRPAVVTATTTGQEWSVYAHYSHPDETGKAEYYQCRMAGGSMENLNEFKQGRKILRNMQDFAREQASDLRDSLHKHYNENGSPARSQHPNTKNGANSVASKTPSVASNGSGRQQGQVTPKSASSHGSSTSAPRNPNIGPGGQTGPKVLQQQSSGDPKDGSNKSKSHRSPHTIDHMMRPPATAATTSPASGGRGVTGSRHAHQDMDIPSKLDQSPSGPSASHSPAAQLSSIPQATTRAKTPIQGPSSSASSSCSGGSRQSTSSAEARRHRTRDEEEQKDLLRRRSDSPDKNRPARPQDGKTNIPPKKGSLFGRFGTGKKRDENLGND